MTWFTGKREGWQTTNTHIASSQRCGDPDNSIVLLQWQLFCKHKPPRCSYGNSQKPKMAFLAPFESNSTGQSINYTQKGSKINFIKNLPTAN